MIQLKVKKKPSVPTTTDPDQQFANWTGSTDTKVMADDLSKRGLLGADQLVNEKQDTSSADAIKNKNQSDWKIAAIQNVLANAHKFGVRTPEGIEANKNVLIGNPKWVDAINDPTFNTIHPNFWPVVKGIVKDQWEKTDATNKNQVAAK